MKTIVIDSCVFIKLFLIEELSDEVDELFQGFIKEDVIIYVPRLFLYEVLSSASNNKIELKTIFKLINQYQSTILEFVDEDDEVFKIAESISSNGHDKSGYPSFYDSIFHAIAIAKKCDFITDDKKHFEKTKKHRHIKLLKDVV
jgi:predicted nucleic acid-binding protein